MDMNAIVESLNTAGFWFMRFAFPMLLQSCVLIAVLLLLDTLLRKKVRAIIRYCLWMLLLLKLVLPVTLSAPTGIGYWVGGNFLNPVIEPAVVEQPAAPLQTETWELPAGMIASSREGLATEFEPTDLPPMSLQNASPVSAAPVTPAAPETVIAAAPSATDSADNKDPCIVWQGVVFAVWVVVAMGMLLLIIQRSIFVSGLIKQAKDAGDKLTGLLEKCKNRPGINIKRNIRLKLSPSATSPAVCGLFRPVILIPNYLPDKLNPRHLEAVLVHELAHIKRGDLWVNMIQAMLQIFYFYNPLLWIANAVIRRVREQAVDEAVLVAMGTEANEYPETLLSVATLSLARPALSLRLIGVVESKSALTERIKHILTRPIPKSAKLGTLGLIAMLLAAAVLLPMAQAEKKVIDEHTAAALAAMEESEKTEAPAAKDDKKDAKVCYSFDVDDGLTLSCPDKGMKIGVQDGELRIWGKTTDTKWGGAKAEVTVKDRDGEMDFSVDFKIPKRQDYGLVYLGFYPEGPTGPPMILYQWKPQKKTFFGLLESSKSKGWYQVHTMWIKVKWWLENGRGRFPDVGTEETKFVNMRMRLRENRTQVDYYVDDVLVDTLNLEKPVGRISKAQVGFQTPKLGYEYDIRFDNLKISSKLPTAKQEKAEPEKSKASEPSFKVRLPSGVVVELVGVSKLHSKNKQWWHPNGNVLKKAPCVGMKNPLKKYQYELVMKVDGHKNISDRWRVSGASTTNVGGPRDKDGRSIYNLRALGAGWKKIPKTTTVRYGIATGKWETLFKCSTTGSNSEKLGNQSAILSQPQQQDGATIINLASTITKPATRVVAVIKSGDIVQSSSTGSGGSDILIHTHKFSLPLSEIDHFEFQTRPYEWVEFKNVSLQLGHKTNVKVVVDAGEKTTGGAASVTKGADNTSLPKGKCSIRGKVVSAETGEPIPGAKVYLFYTVTLEPLFVYAAEDGSFALENIPTGPFSLRTIRTPGYQGAAYNPDDKDGLFPRFSLKEGEQRKDVLIKMKPAFRISGKILDENGKIPADISNFTVWACVRKKDSDGYEVQAIKKSTIDATDGSWFIDGLDGRAVYAMALNSTVAKRGDGYPPIYYPGTFSRKHAKLITFDDKVRSVENIDIKLKKEGGVVIEGIVTDETGQPIPEAFVVVHSHDLLFDFSTAYTDKTGHYKIQGLGEGEFVVQVDAGHRGFIRTRRPFDIDSKTPKMQLDVKLKPGATISGKFVDADGSDWEIANSYGSAYLKNSQDKDLWGVSFVQTGFHSKHQPKDVAGDRNGTGFVLGTGDYGKAGMLFPTKNTFLLQGLAPGKTKLNFFPRQKDHELLDIIYDGKSVMKDGLDVKSGEEIKSVIIKVGKAETKPPAVPKPKPAAEDAKLQKQLIGWVEKFFSRNYRDVKNRKTIEWGAPKKLADGNYSIRYKYKCSIWDKERMIGNEIFTFTSAGKYVSAKKVEGYPQWPDRKAPGKSINTAKDATFGAVVERVLPYTKKRHAVLLDLETGKFKLKKDFGENDRETHRWVRANGLDLSVVKDKGVIVGLGFDLVVMPVPHQKWSETTPAKLTSNFGLNQTEPNKITPLVPHKAPNQPGTYLIRTREDSYGILQILGTSSDPQGVKIRYKLLQKADAKAADPAKPVPYTQTMINNIQPDGSINFKSIIQYTNTYGRTLKTIGFQNSDFVHVKKMTDAAGKPLAFTSKHVGRSFRYKVTLNKPVAPGQPVLYSSSGTISKLISQTAPGKFRYRMKHYPSTGKPTRRIEIHRLPPGAKLLKIIPKSATRSIKNGRIEIFVDKIIKPGGSLTVSYNYALSPPPTPKPAPKPSARVYQFAAPNYSLVDEPMRIKPRTLDKGRNADEVSPSEAVVFGWPIRWWSSHWSGPRNTNAVTMAQGKDSVRFVVNPAARKVWVKYFDIPIDPQQYPIAVMTYRAKRTHTTSSGYVLYLDDTSGPDYGGVMPFAQKDIIPDGEVHTISCDLRPMKPIGDLIGLAVGVESAPEGKAEFELLDLRFEAAPGATSRKIELDAPRIVQVVDVSGDPIPGATVTIDAGRSNWARSVKTNADGKATVRGYRTKPGKHMLRVTADGMTPTEVRNLPSDDKQDVRVALQPEAIYRGVVHDADDKPLAGATVKINIPQRRDMSQWMRTTAEVLTNEQGKWESPPLPKTNQKVSLQIFHPDYMIPGVLFRARRSLDDMGQDATPLKVRRKLIILNGQVKNWLGRPVRDATVDVYFPGKAKRVTMRRFVTDGEGNFSMRSKKASVVLVVRAKGYAPVTMQMQLDEENAPLAIKLEPPHTLQGTVVDDEGNPLPDVAVEIMLQHEKVSPRIAKVRTGADGVFRWDGAPKDEVLVTVTKAGYETAKAKMTAGEISQPVELEKAPPVVTEPPKPRLRRKGYDPRNFRNVS